MIEGYKISSIKEEMDFSVIHNFISSSNWAYGIPVSTLQKAIQNSLCFGVFTSLNEQVGFARVVTDFSTYAYLCDVFILEMHRGKGLSKWLVKEVVEHAELQGLRRFTLVTKDAHNLYAKFGFKNISSPERFMEIWLPEVYKNA